MFAWELNDPLVAEAVNALTVGARAGLVDLLNALVFDPVDYGRTAGESVGKAVRMLPFGGGRGLVTFQVYEPDRLVLVLRVQWVG